MKRTKSIDRSSPFDPSLIDTNRMHLSLAGRFFFVAEALLFAFAQVPRVRPRVDLAPTMSAEFATSFINGIVNAANIQHVRTLHISKTARTRNTTKAAIQDHLQDGFGQRKQHLRNMSDTFAENITVQDGRSLM